MSFRIDRNSLPGLYAEMGKENVASAPKEKMAAQKLDKIELSQEGQKVRDLSSANALVKGELTKEAAFEKLQEIRNQIENGSYNVPSKEIVAAILSGIPHDQAE